MKLTMIAAVALNNVIGKTHGDRSQTIPWRLKSDMKFFKEMTMGKPMIMGRKTFETFPKPLPGRPHIVISRRVQPGFVEVDGMSYDFRRNMLPYRAQVLWVNNLNDAFILANKLVTDLVDPEIMVIGGGQIYAEAIDSCNRMYITQVYAEPEGDIYFPSYGYEWTEVNRTRGTASEDNQYNFDFVVLERRGKIPKPILHTS